MGDIAEMMMDGTLCPTCGTYVGSGLDAPTYCSDECKPEEYKRAEKTTKDMLADLKKAAGLDR